MKVSLNWLQTYFDEPLPNADEIADALTFHVAEIEEVTPNYIDVNVLPDRAAYLLSHRGVAAELSAILNRPLKQDPLRTALPEWPRTNELEVSIQNPEKCLRYIGAVVHGVKIGPSPTWLKEAIESVGQRSINNVVDATNYVMLNIGQPLHAFDAGKLKQIDGTYAIEVRGTRGEGKMFTLDKVERTLPDGTLIIADANANEALGIAGIKGGLASEIDASTTDLIIESANFDGTTVRRGAQSLKLFTDASVRFQNKISPELAAYGMRDVLALITEIAGGEVVSVVDVYPAPVKTESVSVSLEKINGRLGTVYAAEEVTDVFARLDLSCEQDGDTFTITPPFERRDIVIPDDLAEEVGRIMGYEHIESTQLPEITAPDLARYRGIERIKDFLIERGYTEISTQSFAVKGDIYLANPLDMTKPALRTTLAENMRDALTRGTNVAPLAVGVESMLKLFEVGSVFTKEGERSVLALGYQQLSGKKSDAILGELADALGSEFGMHTSLLDSNVAEADLSDVNLDGLGRDYVPQKIVQGDFRPFSLYPFALRDIAVWTPEETEESEISILIQKEAGELLARSDRFDRFEKDGRTSFAFRLVFQSFERTLADTDLDPLMEKITAALNAQDGWEVR